MKEKGGKRRDPKRPPVRVSDQKNITAESGQDVTLTCRAANNNFIIVQWSRADLGDEYVFVHRGGKFVPDDQHPSFKNRVGLQDRQMKDGDVSLILKDVTINDTGTYECRVVQEEGGPMILINSTNLVVDPPGQTGGHTEDGGKEDGGKKDGGEKEDGGKKDGGEKSGSVGLIVGLSVATVLIVATVAGFLIYRKHKKQKQDSYEPPVEMHHV
ncbi:unnamed protein product [Oreochromis niloticus]|nr:unnamed protein product [Mustela putorius furo]